MQDVQDAADVFRPVHDETGGRDGYVSLEVSPKLAHDTEGTLEEARRLWQALDRPNVLIKVPATQEGLPAIRQLISEGINVNVTLLFAISRYQEVAEAYLGGLEDRHAAGQPLTGIASVASFFLSRIDVAVDPLLEAQMHPGAEHAALAEDLHGQVALASAKVAYQRYQGLFAGERWEKLAKAGAQTQRLLWASTSTKNPAYSDVRYVEGLIGPTPSTPSRWRPSTPTGTTAIPRRASSATWTPPSRPSPASVTWASTWSRSRRGSSWTRASTSSSGPSRS